MIYRPKDPQFCSGGLPCQIYSCAFFDCCEFSDFWTEEELEIFQTKQTSSGCVETATFCKPIANCWPTESPVETADKNRGAIGKSAVCGVEEVSKCPRQN